MTGSKRQKHEAPLSPSCSIKVQPLAHQQNVDADSQEQNSNGTEDFMKLRRLFDPWVPYLEVGPLYQGNGHNSFLPLHIYLCIYISMSIYICVYMSIYIFYIPCCRFELYISHGR